MKRKILAPRTSQHELSDQDSETQRLHQNQVEATGEDYVRISELSTKNKKSSLAAQRFWSARLGRLSFPKKKSWSYGLYVGLYASIAVLLSNIVILLAAIFAHEGVVGGIGTIAKGQTGDVHRISTAYHILINILSTILLTSSNYAMQVLCAPTRKEINLAHQNGKALDIGIMSVRNLTRLDRKRVTIFIMLALSSAPLHLLYNSAVFEVTAAHDYEVSLMANTSLRLPDSGDWKKMENSVWQKTYSDSYGSGYGDLILVVDQVSFPITINNNWTYSLSSTTWGYASSSTTSDSLECSWKPTSLDAPVWDIGVALNGSKIQPQSSQALRAVTDLETYYKQRTRYPEVDWSPKKKSRVYAENTLEYGLTLCPGDAWLAQNPEFHIAYAQAKVITHGSKVQVAIAFLAVVIACNVAKVFSIYMTIKACSPQHLVTVGDAVASFLETPEKLTEWRCTARTPGEVLEPFKKNPEPWKKRVTRMMFVLGGSRVWSMSIIIICAGMTIAALSKSANKLAIFQWGTSSPFIIGSTKSPFTPRGAIIVAFLSNLPQVCLSLFYFSINRLCTSLCFAREWDDYAIYAQGLRVTSPSGAQRDTYFLQLPYRWSVPLSVVSGLLHWLLSQSLFLVRREMRTRTGELYPESICACGYSASSLVVFTALFFGLLVVLLGLMLRRMELHIPPARHSSLMISAACHPHSDEPELWLEEVIWGATVKPEDEVWGHCTFSSTATFKLEEGKIYA